MAFAYAAATAPQASASAPEWVGTVDFHVDDHGNTTDGGTFKETAYAQLTLDGSGGGELTTLTFDEEIVHPPGTNCATSDTIHAGATAVDVPAVDVSVTRGFDGSTQFSVTLPGTAPDLPFIDQRVGDCIPDTTVSHGLATVLANGVAPANILSLDGTTVSGGTHDTSSAMIAIAQISPGQYGTSSVEFNLTRAPFSVAATFPSTVYPGTYPLEVSFPVAPASGDPLLLSLTCTVCAPGGSIHEGNGWPIQVDPPYNPLSLPIVVEPGTPPGTYVYAIGALDLGKGITSSSTITIVVSDPPTARYTSATAVVTRMRYVNPSASTDSLPNGTYATNTIRAWRGEIDNYYGAGSPAVPGPHISVSGANPSWAWSGAPPNFPIGADGLDVGPNSQFVFGRLDNGPSDSHAWVQDVPVTPGFDAARTEDPLTLPAGGGDQTFTASVTPRDASYDFAEIDVTTHDPSSAGIGATITGVTTPTLTDEHLDPRPSPQPNDHYEWAIHGAHPGQTYTVQFTVHVPLGGTFKPFVQVRSGHSTPVPGTIASAISVPDGELGGDWSFSSTDPVRWDAAISDVNTVNLQSVTPSAVNAPDYDLSVAPTTLTVRAGSSFNLAATVTPANGFAGDVSFWLTKTGVDPNGGWPQPFFQSPTWSHATVSGPTAVTLGVGVPDSVAPGDYFVTLGADATGAQIPDKTVDLIVHVLSAPSFSLSAAPDDLTVVAGQTVSTTITVDPANDFANTVFVSLSGAAGGGFDSLPFGIHPVSTWGGIAPGASDSVTIGAGLRTAPGDYQLFVYGNDAHQHSFAVPITLHVLPAPDYALSVDQADVTVYAGSSVDFRTTITPANGFAGDMSFWLTTTGVDPNGGWPSQFVQSSPWPRATVSGPTTVTLGLGTTEATPLGDYDLTVGANATGAQIPDKTVRIHVHVVAPLSAFVSASGTKLMLNHQQFRAVGMNIYNANSNGWCNSAMDGTLLDTALTSIGNGQTAMRAWFFQQLATTNGQRDWTAFDRTLAAAKAHHVKVIATLVDQWGPCGVTRPGVEDFKDTTWYTDRYKQPDPIGTVSYRDWAQEVAARYKNDPTVLAWQLVNEPEVKPTAASGCDNEAASASTLQSFARDVSGAIRAVDPIHLISLGTIGNGQCGTQSTDYPAVMSIPTLDLCEYHDYDSGTPVPGDVWNGLAQRISECKALGKPLIVGELGVRPSDVGDGLDHRARTIANKFCAQFAAGVAGELLWDWSSAGSAGNGYEIGPRDPVLDLFGPWSDPAHVCTAPEPVRGPVAAAGDGSASVSWLPPTSDGGAPVTVYRVTASPGGATAFVDGFDTTATFTGLSNGTAYTFGVVAGNAAGASTSASSAAVTPVAGAGTPSTAAGVAAPGGTVATANAAAPTPGQPVGIALTTPTGGTISIATTSSAAAAPVSYDLVGQQVQITAPAASITAPLQLVFTLDASALAPSGDAASVQIFRDGVALPDCSGPAGTASPDACVQSRASIAGGDVRVTVLSSHASLWGMGFAGTPLAVTRQSPDGNVRVQPGDAVKVGYAFSLPGKHAAGSVVFARTTATFTAQCVGKPGNTTFTVSLPRKAYAFDANGTGWIPTAEPKDPAGYQVSSLVPNLCAGGLISLASGGSFSTLFRTSAGTKLSVRWHFSAAGSPGGWSSAQATP